MSSARRIPNSVLLPYGMMTLPLATAGLPLAIFIPPFYTDTVGLSFTAVGIALMLSRLLDIFFDPLIGRLSDKTRTSFGRRRPWILAGAPLMMLSVWQVFDPPAGTTPLSFFVWIALYYISFTMITVPYFAWGTELTNDYDERSRVAGAREIWTAAGMLMAIFLPAIINPAPEIGDRIAREIAEVATQTITLGYVTIALIPVVVLLLFVSVRESPPEAGSGRHGNWLTLLSSRPLQMLLAGQILAGLAFGINQTTIIHYLRYRIALPKDQADLAGISFFVAALLGVWLWIWIGRKIGKRKGMALATLLNGLFLGAAPFVQPGDFFGAVLLQVGSGFVFEGPLILGASMLADVIELDFLKSGIQRSAAFVAVWMIGRKFTEAAGAGIGLPMLEYLGFSTQAPDTAQAQIALTIVSAVIPCCLGVVAVIPILAYPLNRKAQSRIRAAIEKRKRLRSTAKDSHAASESAWDESRRATLLSYEGRP